MTALERYQRLEATGIWREDSGAPAREVIVSFGEATLTLSDLAERPLGHWALAGMRVLQETQGEAVYATTADGYETLTIRDGDMIAAIGAVSRTTAPHRRPDERRGRGWVWPSFAGLAALAALAVFGPDLLRAQAVRMTSPERAAEYGDRMLLDIMETRGALCAAPAGISALEDLAARVLPGMAVRVRVIGLGGAPFALLPGGTVLLDRTMIAEASGPEEVAGWIALALPAPGPDGGVEALMRAAGPAGQLRHVLSGDVGAPALTRAAAEALDTEPQAGRAALAMARMEAAGMGGGDLSENLRAADPAAPPVLDPAGWASIRAVCG